MWSGTGKRDPEKQALLGENSVNNVKKNKWKGKNVQKIMLSSLTTHLGKNGIRILYDTALKDHKK